MDDEPSDSRSDEAAEAIVAFFRAMPAGVRREYEELAARDRRFGEDSAAEMRS